MSVKSLQYPSLNGLRAMSILIVIFHHLKIQFSLFIKPSNYFPLMSDGQFGVNVFFVISGFLITGLLLKEESKTGTISLGKFYTRRTLRIFPAYYFLLLVYFFLSRHHYIYISHVSWLTALTYTKYFNTGLDWYTAHAWSLSIEEHFYLMWPLVFLVGKKARKLFIFLVIILVPAVRVYFNLHTGSWINDFTIFYRMDAIAIGCAFAIYEKELLNKFSMHWKMVFYVSITFLLILPWISILSERYRLHLGFFIVPFGGSHGTFANIFIACIMMFSVFGPETPWFKFLNLKIMNLVGLWSYSLYLWQQFFLYNTEKWYNVFPLNIFLLMAAALSSYYLIEKPFLKLKSKLKV